MPVDAARVLPLDVSEDAPILSDEEPPADLDEVLRYENGQLDEDVFGFAIKTLVLDSCVLAHLTAVRPKGLGRKRCLRSSRIAYAVVILFATLAMQLFLLLETKQLVTSRAVFKARRAYEKFERAMYGGEEHCYFSAADGKKRGKPECFLAHLFLKMDQEDREEICSIPISRPGFAFVVLLIWSLTCMGEIKSCVETLRSLILELPTSHSLKDIIQEKNGSTCLVALTPWLKAVVAGGVLLPRVVNTLFVMWLGTRWLLATFSFEDLLLNAVALEFILCLKSLLYTVLVSARSKVEIKTMQIERPEELQLQVPSCQAFMGVMMWALVAIAWVYAYMYSFQDILPDFNYDVQQVCTKWVASVVRKARKSSH